jgi:hypothetical protein
MKYRQVWYLWEEVVALRMCNAGLVTVIVTAMLIALAF